MIVAAEALDVHDESAKVFEVFIQLGAILAVLVEYRQKFLHVALNCTRDIKAIKFVSNLILAFLPAAFAGLIFYSAIKKYLFSVQTVGIALIIGGIIILLVERAPPSPKIHDTDNMSWREALIVGFAQILALFPGVSRSGATIIGGMLSGLSRRTATEFSFFLAVPTMIAAVGYDLFQNFKSLDTEDWIGMAIGFSVSFVSALFAIKWLLSFVSTQNFKIFGWYRIGFGMLLLMTLAVD